MRVYLGIGKTDRKVYKIFDTQGTITKVFDNPNIIILETRLQNDFEVSKNAKLFSDYVILESSIESPNLESIYINAIKKYYPTPDGVQTEMF